MSATSNYRGYTGSIEWSEEDGLFYGQVLGIRSLVSYDGETEEDAERCFRDMVDAYIDTCAAHAAASYAPSRSISRRAGVLQG